jgi:hypothetical protein
MRKLYFALILIAVAVLVWVICYYGLTAMTPLRSHAPRAAQLEDQ